jgi:hypothetical protein
VPPLSEAPHPPLPSPTKAWHYSHPHLPALLFVQLQQGGGGDAGHPPQQRVPIRPSTQHQLVVEGVVRHTPHPGGASRHTGHRMANTTDGWAQTRHGESHTCTLGSCQCARGEEALGRCKGCVCVFGLERRRVVVGCAQLTSHGRPPMQHPSHTTLHQAIPLHATSRHSPVRVLSERLHGGLQLPKVPKLDHSIIPASRNKSVRGWGCANGSRAITPPSPSPSHPGLHTHTDS